MTRKTEGLLALIVLAALIILLAVLLSGKPKEPVLPQVDTPSQTTTVPSVNPDLVPPVQTVSAGTVTRVFVERFGSFSSESDYANVEDIMELATDRYAAELEGVVDRARATEDGSYYGVSTTLISLKATEESDARTVFAVTTQRQESVGSPSNTEMRYQDATVTLLKEGEEWKVDSVVWQE